MASKNLMDFEKAIEYMDPMQVTDYLHKTLDFLQRNNNEIYFPSISPYVEAFLVNLVSDPRNLMSKIFKCEDRKLALEIIDFLEMSRDVFRWAHSYENGNVLVYKKIFSNKIKKKPSKPSSIAHRLLQAQPQQSTPPQSPTIGQEALESISQLPDIPATSTSFKLRFLSKTLGFVKDDTEFTLYYPEMALDLAEYLFSLIKYRDKDVGFGYKSLYAPLWEAMEEYGVDYKFEVMLEENSRDKAILKLEKVPKNNKSKRNTLTRKEDIPEITNNNVNGQKKEEILKNMSKKPTQECSKQNQSPSQRINITSPDFPRLELLSNINERFFKDAVVALTEFADDQERASIGFQQLADEEIAFVKRVKTLAESSKVREMFSPKYRDLLWRLDYSIKEVQKTCKITTTVNKTERSITLKKTPRFATPLPLPATQQTSTTLKKTPRFANPLLLPATQQTVATGSRSKSLASTNTRDRSISKDRIIQFEKGGKLPASGDVEPTTDKENQQERGRSRDGLSKRKAKLLEDLSTPVESDRGIRMMLLMGWNGGALGARGDGIMEPVMPNIEQPIRGGLGHVPPPKPPKVTPRRPLDFRLTFLQSVYDLLLHDEMQKEIQLKEPLVKKEANFVQFALACFNKRRCLALTGPENELVSQVVGELHRRPGVKVRHEFSNDFKTVILHKVMNQPVTVPKPKPVKKRPEVITITDDDIDVLVTERDVGGVMPHVTVAQTEGAASHKTIRKRAVRLLVLTKFAEVLHWNFQSRIIFKFNFMLPKHLKLFMRTIIDGLNNDQRHYNLLGWETEIYGDLREMVRGSMLTWEKMPGSKYVLTRTHLIDEDILPNAAYLPDNNNDDKTGNRNQIINIDDCTEQINIECIEEENNVFENYLHSQGLVQAILTTTSNFEDATSNIDINNKDDYLTGDIFKTSIQGRDNTEGIVGPIKNDVTRYVTVKDVNRINAEVDRYILFQNEKTEVAEVTSNTECDIPEPSVKESDLIINGEINNNGVTEEDKIKVRDIIELSDWDRDIQDLEMTILNVDLDCVVKVETDTDCDLQMANSETDPNMNIKIEKGMNDLNAKRSHSSSVCSQELDPKKVKISCESDEHVVIITPKNPEENLTEEIVKQVQTLMSKKLEKAVRFLPLLKCHGFQNGGLIYSCHDEDDVAWLKNVIGANLDVEIVPCNALCSEKNIRELLIRINSYIPLDARKIFRKFEIYNVGLDTKYWKVSYKHTGSGFIMFIVTVDEKSFKYISDEKFSLYCGIDKAQFSIIY